jgi:hypothetical protein
MLCTGRAKDSRTEGTVVTEGAFQGNRTCRALLGDISTLTENITIRDHRALRASFSLPSLLLIAYGLRLNVI